MHFIFWTYDDREFVPLWLSYPIGFSLNNNLKISLKVISYWLYLSIGLWTLSLWLFVFVASDPDVFTLLVIWECKLRMELKFEILGLYTCTSVLSFPFLIALVKHICPVLDEWGDKNKKFLIFWRLLCLTINKCKLILFSFPSWRFIDWLLFWVLCCSRDMANWVVQRKLNGITGKIPLYKDLCFYLLCP